MTAADRKFLEELIASTGLADVLDTLAEISNTQISCSAEAQTPRLLNTLSDEMKNAIWGDLIEETRDCLGDVARDMLDNMDDDELRERVDAYNEENAEG